MSQAHNSTELNMASEQLNDYDLIVINHSGGKDSVAMCHWIATHCDRSKCVVVHATFAEEWNGAKEIAQQQAADLGIRFIVTKARNAAGDEVDLLDKVRARGMWPSSSARYCTSDMKRGPIQRVITQLHREAGSPKGYRVANCLGLRAAESSARAKRSEIEHAARGTTKSRTVDNHHPILSWDDADLWSYIHQNNLPIHEAYKAGLPRLSCQFCVFAPKAALVLAAKLSPAKFAEYLAVEREIGHTFTAKLSLEEIAAEVESGATQLEVIESWSM